MPRYDRDAALVGSFLQGDLSAFDALVARHRGHVYGVAYRMTRDREAAEDITVEAFCEAYRGLPRFRPQARFSTWLHRITVNVCLEHLRHARRKRQVEEVALEDDLPAPTDAAETVITRDLACRIVRAIEELPPAQQEAIRMFYFEQRSCAEIAQALKIPRNTVKTRLFYGTKALRDRFEAEAVLESEGELHVEM